MNNKDDNKMVQFGKSGKSAKVFFNGKPIGMSNNLHFLVDPADVEKMYGMSSYRSNQQRPPMQQMGNSPKKPPGWEPTEFNFAELEERIALVSYDKNAEAQARWEHKTPEEINEDLLSAIKMVRNSIRNVLVVDNPFKDLAKQAAKDFKNFSNLKQVAPSLVRTRCIEDLTTNVPCNCADSMKALENNVLVIKGKMLKEEKTLLAKLATEGPMDVNIKGRRPKWLK